MPDSNAYISAAESINALGIDLLLSLYKIGANTLLSPYSIQSAFIQAYAGAQGETRAEMARVLHYPRQGSEIHFSFSSLCSELNDITPDAAMAGKRMTLSLANRIFLQAGFDIVPRFTNFLEYIHGAKLDQLDFAADPNSASRYINAWVEEQTHKRIRNLVPPGSLSHLTRIVLANAIYLKAPWLEPFQKDQTEALPFHLQADETIRVPTMNRSLHVGLSKRDNHTIVTLPYSLGEIQFVILMPKDITGLDELAHKLSTRLLEECTALEICEVDLQMPKFRIESPCMQLKREFIALGMKSAFDVPLGSANFEGIAPKRDSDYLAISEICHMTLLDLDEDGTEAAAATAIEALALGASYHEEPEHISIDRPFFFAIQHRNSGACLFLGCLADPR
jgi:serine protease inhibitor